MQIRISGLPARWLVSLLGVLALASAQAQILAQAQAQARSDPTRPAPAWLAAQSQAPGAEALPEPGSPDVQIVVFGPERKFAMINGQTVRPGETYRGSKLIAINEDGVVWRREGITEKTSMNPAVSKKVLGAQPMAGKARAKKKPVNGEGQ